MAFVIIRLTPGDPAAMMLGQDVSAEGLQAVKERLGLDKPLLIQLINWLTNALQGNLGESFFLGQPVSEAIWDRLPVTFSLALSSVIVALLIGFPLGMLAALRCNSLVDAATMGISLLGLSIPEFLLGLGLIHVFSVRLHWLPVGGYVSFTKDFVGWLRHMLMPAFTLGFMQAALIARMTRSSMLEVLLNDYIQVARSKGLKERKVIWKHALRNAALPIVATVGLVFVLLLGGAFITESVFRLPGVGNLVISAVQRRDYPIIQGSLLFIATAVLLINLVIDLLYAYLDPRIRYE